MNLLDIINLTKAGYKKADIDKMLANQIDEPEPEPQLQSTELDDGSKGEPEPSPEPSANNEPDYKQMYEDLQNQVEELKNNLKEAQAMNIKKDASGGAKEPDAWDSLKDFAKAIM